jgi:hypothetical protein
MKLSVRQILRVVSENAEDKSVTRQRPKKIIHPKIAAHGTTVLQ